MLPFFLEPNSINDVRKFRLKIPGIIDINNLISEIRLPHADYNVNKNLLANFTKSDIMDI